MKDLCKQRSIIECAFPIILHNFLDLFIDETKMRHDIWHFVNFEVVLAALDIILSLLHSRNKAIGHVLYILCQLAEG